MSKSDKPNALPITPIGNRPIEDMLNDPLINAKVRRQEFLKRVYELHVTDAGTDFCILFPNKDVEQLQRDAESGALQKREGKWLDLFFPGEAIRFANLQWVNVERDGKTHRLPGLKVELPGSDMRRKFTDLMNGTAPDYQHILKVVDSEAGSKKYLLGRVFGEPKDLVSKDPAADDDLSVIFSIPPGTRPHLEDEFITQYGTDVTFEPVEVEGPKHEQSPHMIKLGAILGGETARQFFNDYKQIKRG